MKNILTVSKWTAAALLAVTSLCADEVILNGGKITPLSGVIVAVSSHDMNFCLANRFADGTVHLTHTIGVHVVNERGRAAVSRDGGKTWEARETQYSFAMNSFDNRQGQKCRILCWDDAMTATHELDFNILAEDGKSFSHGKIPVTLPYASSLRVQRQMLRLRDGRLLMPAYGRKESARGNHCLLLVSADDGESWQFLADVADSNEVPSVEGPNEAAVAELADGTLLCVYRIGGKEGLAQKRSSDGGKTWSKTTKVSEFGACPQLMVMENGTLLLLCGRPGLYLYVDFSGTGTQYQRVTLHDGPDTSSYATVMEVAPDELLVVRDVTNFASICRSRMLNYVLAERLRLVKDPACRASSGDPAGAKFEVYYSGFEQKRPDEFGGFEDTGYAKYRQAGTAEAAVIAVPEHPTPVLRLFHRGESLATGKFNAYRRQLNNNPGALEFETVFRLLDGDAKTPQYAIRVTLQQGMSQRMAVCRFAIDGVHYLDDGKAKFLPLALGVSGKFHKFTVRADAVTGAWSLCRDGQSKALFTAKMSFDPWFGPSIEFGDGSVEVFGAVEVASVGWKELKK